MNPEITKPTIEHLWEYLNYQFPHTQGNIPLRLFCESLKAKQKALEEIAHYDEQSIWMDDRDDASDAMLDVARQALA